MTTPATPPQLSFELDSAGARSTIYVTSDASVNDLTLKIGTTATANFTPAAKVVEQSQAPGVTGSLLYLDLSPLKLTAEEFDAIAPRSAGWQFATFAEDQLIGMTPTTDLTLAPTDTIEVAIGALADAHATGASASLVVNVYRVGGITVGGLPFPTNFSVALVTPPVGQEDLGQDLSVALATPDVVNTVLGYNPVSNQLAFGFYPGPRGRPVTPKATSEINITFVYATDPSGYGALCTTDEVKPPFEVVAGVNAGDWTITPNLMQESPSWTLLPPTTHPIVGTGPRATLAILANNLVTTFQAGPTVALISYSGFEGYADGVFVLPIQKNPHVRIDSLTVRPNPAVLERGTASVMVSWQAENAGTMTLSPFDVDVTGQTSYRGTITETTPITLSAQGPVLASAGNIALRNVTAQILPVINSFDASPGAVYAGGLPRDVELCWNVNTNEELTLVSSVGRPDPNKYSNIGTLQRTIDGPQMLTLIPLGQSGGQTVKRSVVISAFAPQLSSWPVNAKHLAAPPNASFVLASDGQGTVTALDTMVYKPVSGAIPVGTAPAGMAFSSDGSMLYVANSGDGTVSAIAVAATGSVPQYRFTECSTTPVGGAPQQLALSPDGAYLYVTIDAGATAGSFAVLSTGRNPQVVSTLPVDVAPQGLAVMHSGARIFLANSGSSTVTVVGRSPNGHHFVVDHISGLNSAQDVVVTSNDNVLLVSCPALGAVVALNAAFPEAPRTTLTVGASPQQLAVVPGGAYAVVSHEGADTVSLLSVGATPPACRVLDLGIQVGTAPSAVAVTPDAGLVLVGTRSGLSVLTLAEYETAQAPPAVGKHPTDVVVAPDGKTVVAWHDALTWIWPGPSSTGLFVYDVASETVTPQLANVQVVDLAFHPVASEKAAFLTEEAKSSVSVMRTDDWTVLSSIDVSNQTAGLPVKLAISGDGTTLFVLTADRALKCELLVYEGSPHSYVSKGVVQVLTSSEGSALTLVAAPDGSRVYVTDEVSGDLFFAARDRSGNWALAGEPMVVGQSPTAAAASPDGTTLYVTAAGTSNGSLVKVDTATRAATTVVMPANSLTSLAGLAVSPDGDRVFATDSIAAGIRVFDATSLRLVQTISWESGAQAPKGIAVALDAARIFTANTNSNDLGVVTQVQGGTTVNGLDAATTGAESDTSNCQGLFLRDYVGQTPQSGNTTGSYTDCPDIWPSGQQYLPDPQTTLVNGYGNDSPNVIYVSGAGSYNYVYVRGLNATSGQNTSRVWLYYVNGGGNSALILWPPSWLNSGIAAAHTGLPYIDVSSSSPNEIDYTSPPFEWNAVPINGHYCMIAWVTNQPLSTTDPRTTIGSIGTMDQLAQFIITHPNMGWKNTADVPTPAGESWQIPLTLQGPPVGGHFKAGLQFKNMPTDAYFSFSIVGPTTAGSVNYPKTQISLANETVLVPLDWTGYSNYATNIVLRYYAGSTAIPQGANITVTAAMNLSGIVGLVPDPLVGAIRANVYPTGRPEDGFQQEWLTLVGTVQLNPVTKS